MKKIDKPVITQEEILDILDCNNYRNRIIEKANNYKYYLDNLPVLYNDELLMINSDSDYKSTMIKLYSQRFSNKSYDKAYNYYNILRNSQKHCPYCNFPTRAVKQLDHYLPKSNFPSQAINPQNLVPICIDCNELKKSSYSLKKSKMFIHPYYDDFINNPFEFVKCRIIENDNIGFSFYIKSLDEWDEDKYNCVCFHFKELKLDDLYRTDFESDFSTYITELVINYNESPNINQIKSNIKRKCKALKINGEKPWQYAGYDSILSSSWFWDYYFIKKANSQNE